MALLVVVDVPLPEPPSLEKKTSQSGSAPIVAPAAAQEGTPACVASGTSEKERGHSSDTISPKGTAARLVIANTHLLFNPKRGDIKTAQLMVLTKNVERCAKVGRTGVRCGVPGSDSVKSPARVRALLFAS